MEKHNYGNYAEYFTKHFSIYYQTKCMWEYDRVVIKFKQNDELLERINHLGANGWEIISYIENTPKKFSDSWESTILIKRKLK